MRFPVLTFSDGLLRLGIALLIAAALGRLVASEWTQRPDLPVPLGRAGMIAGVDAGVLIAAGGANFPGKMPWDGGMKVYYDDILVLAPGGTWRTAGRLPQARAYSATVPTANGLLVIGGENAETLFQESLLLRWDGGKVTVGRGPALPAPRTSPAAVVLEGNVYVAGGFAPGTVRQSSRDFWRLDRAQPDGVWKPLSSWPGPTRAQAVMAALEGDIYLISGLEMVVDAQGKPKPTYLTDAYRYRGDAWERLPDPPWSAIAAPSPAPRTARPARLFVLGGVDGRRVGKVPRDTRVPNHIMYFDVAGHAWRTVEERWPDPVVTAPAVWFDGAWWIVSGETMAGVRTVSVWSWKP